MTTSYELSLRLKESGVPQEGGEYYWVDWMDKGIKCVHKTQLHETMVIICRAFTLGELVRELGVFVVSCVNSDYIFSSNHISMRSYSPEEAAGELWAELLKQEKQKA